MVRTVVALLSVLMLVGACDAAPVYKCKGINNETIYQNLPCPSGTKAIAHGEYAPTEDNPTQYYDAVREGEAIRARREQEAAAKSRNAGAQQERADRESELATAISQEKSDAKYRSDKKRWGSRLAGPKPIGYDERNAQSFVSQGKSAPLVQSLPTPPERVTYDDCKQVVSSVHCRGSDGSMATGSVDAWGNGRAHGTGGDVRFHPDPIGGGVRTDSGACVKDAYGQCH
jgi:hypothetical protein